jgi:protein-L-isoaspartate(D-aspartate) O-methyltransferase
MSWFHATFLRFVSSAQSMDARETLLKTIEAEMRATARWTGRSHLAPSVHAALLAVRREAFVPPVLRPKAYANHPLRIGHGQTISQPFIVALMTDLLDPAPDHVVLEVGTGSGYQAAVLAALVRHVYSIEIISSLSAQAATALTQEGIGNVTSRTGDGAAGWAEHAPYDGIIMTAAGPTVPPALLTQLRPGGRMVIPVGEPFGDQMLVLISKTADGSVTHRDIIPVAFVPLTGASGGTRSSDGQ